MSEGQCPVPIGNEVNCGSSKAICESHNCCWDPEGDGPDCYYQDFCLSSTQCVSKDGGLTTELACNQAIDVVTGNGCCWNKNSNVCLIRSGVCNENPSSPKISCGSGQEECSAKSCCWQRLQDYACFYNQGDCQSDISTIVCGGGFITDSNTCEQAGCCWKNNQCLQRTQACDIVEADKEDCGIGDHVHACTNMGCCWDPISTPKCYRFKAISTTYWTGKTESTTQPLNATTSNPNGANLAVIIPCSILLILLIIAIPLAYWWYTRIYLPGKEHKPKTTRSAPGNVSKSAISAPTHVITTTRHGSRDFDLNDLRKMSYRKSSYPLPMVDRLPDLVENVYYESAHELRKYSTDSQIYYTIEDTAMDTSDYGGTYHAIDEPRVYLAVEEPEANNIYENINKISLQYRGSTSQI